MSFVQTLLIKLKFLHLWFYNPSTKSSKNDSIKNKIIEYASTLQYAPLCFNRELQMNFLYNFEQSTWTLHNNKKKMKSGI